MPTSHHPPRATPLYHMLGLPSIKGCRQFRRARLEKLRKGNRRLPHIEPDGIMHHRILRVKGFPEHFSNNRIRPQKAFPIKPANTTSCGRTPEVFHRKKFFSTAIHRPRHKPQPLAPEPPWTPSAGGSENFSRFPRRPAARGDSACSRHHPSLFTHADSTQLNSNRRPSRETNARCPQEWGAGQKSCTSLAGGCHGLLVKPCDRHPPHRLTSNRWHP